MGKADNKSALQNNRTICLPFSGLERAGYLLTCFGKGTSLERRRWQVRCLRSEEQKM